MAKKLLTDINSNGRVYIELPRGIGKRKTVMKHLKLLLIDEVIEQIRKDVMIGDYTAIEELLLNVPTENLKAFLPEE